MDDARFETIVVKQTKQSVLEEARQLANGKITAKRGMTRMGEDRVGPTKVEPRSRPRIASSAFRFLRQRIARGSVLFFTGVSLGRSSVENGFDTNHRFHRM